MSAPRLEYRVCQVQEPRIICANGNRQGRIAPAQSNVREALSSCLLEWDYLNTAGEDSSAQPVVTAATAMRAWCT